MRSVTRRHWMRNGLLLAGAVAAGCQRSNLAEIPGKFATYLIPHWNLTKEYTLDFANTMPPEHYTFHPTEPQMTYGEQLCHVGGSVVDGTIQMMGLEEPPVSKPEDQNDKEAVIRYVTQSFDLGASHLNTLSEEMADEEIQWGSGAYSRREIYISMMDHVAHHRGQMVVYVRLNGIVHPQYRY